MNFIRSVIVDDEQHNRNLLRTLLLKYCPSVEVIAEAGNADEGFDIITKLQPQLVFLDVKMPIKSGFDLLKMFHAIHFEVVFVSAFNEYAVTAFEFNALGYLLKPIDYNKLVLNVNKAILKIGLGDRNESILQFIQTIDNKTDAITKIAVHHHEKVILINIVDIVSIEMNEGVCRIYLNDDKQYHSSKDLKLFEGMLKEMNTFIRINKSVIINLSFLKSYSKGDPCLLLMINNKEYEVSRRKKATILTKINFL